MKLTADSRVFQLLSTVNACRPKELYITENRLNGPFRPVFFSTFF